MICLAQIDNAYFGEALDAARSIQDEFYQASALICLCEIDNSYFSEALEAARSIQDEFYQASALICLCEIDNSYFSEALEAARSIQDEFRRADTLTWLCEIDNADFSEALEAARSIQDESSRADVLISLAQYAPNSFLPHIYQAITEITHKLTQIETLSGSLPAFPLASLPAPDWHNHLHLLAHRKRADLMGDLATLYPAIVHLGGEAAGRGMVDGMREVCGQWK